MNDPGAAQTMEHPDPGPSKWLGPSLAFARRTGSIGPHCYTSCACLYRLGGGTLGPLAGPAGRAVGPIVGGFGGMVRLTGVACVGGVGGRIAAFLTSAS